MSGQGQIRNTHNYTQGLVNAQHQPFLPSQPAQYPSQPQMHMQSQQCQGQGVPGQQNHYTGGHAQEQSWHQQATQRDFGFQASQQQHFQGMPDVYAASQQQQPQYYAGAQHEQQAPWATQAGAGPSEFPIGHAMGALATSAADQDADTGDLHSVR